MIKLWGTFTYLPFGLLKINTMRLIYDAAAVYNNSNVLSFRVLLLE